MNIIRIQESHFRDRATEDIKIGDFATCTKSNSEMSVTVTNRTAFALMTESEVDGRYHGNALVALQDCCETCRFRHANCDIYEYLLPEAYCSCPKYKQW